jgi:hypothetical protein
VRVTVFFCLGKLKQGCCLLRVCVCVFEEAVNGLDRDTTS